jgi:hypothetical protein
VIARFFTSEPACHQLGLVAHNAYPAPLVEWGTDLVHENLSVSLRAHSLNAVEESFVVFRRRPPMVFAIGPLTTETPERRVLPIDVAQLLSVVRT